MNPPTTAAARPVDASNVLDLLDTPIDHDAAARRARDRIGDANARPTARQFVDPLDPEPGIAYAHLRSSDAAAIVHRLDNRMTARQIQPGEWDQTEPYTRGDSDNLTRVRYALVGARRNMHPRRYTPFPFTPAEVLDVLAALRTYRAIERAHPQCMTDNTTPLIAALLDALYAVDHRGQGHPLNLNRYITRPPLAITPPPTKPPTKDEA